MASFVIRENNPALWGLIAPLIDSGKAPDPRPISVIEIYKEQWTPTVVWNRLLHELEAISFELEDTNLLQSIQNTTLTSNSGLQLQLIKWNNTYPLLAWTMSFTHPLQMQYYYVAMGAVLAHVTEVKHITKVLLSHIRDIRTARDIRKIAGTKFETMSQKLFWIYVVNRDIGMVYWAFTATKADIPKFSDLHTKQALKTVFNTHNDGDVLEPFMDDTIKFDFNMLFANIEYTRDNYIEALLDQIDSYYRFKNFIEYTIRHYVAEKVQPHLVTYLKCLVDLNTPLDERIMNTIVSVFMESFNSIDHTVKPYSDHTLSNSILTNKKYSNTWIKLLPMVVATDDPNFVLRVLSTNEESEDEDIINAYASVFITMNRVSSGRLLRNVYDLPYIVFQALDMNEKQYHLGMIRTNRPKTYINMLEHESDEEMRKSILKSIIPNLEYGILKDLLPSKLIPYTTVAEHVFIFHLISHNDAFAISFLKALPKEEFTIKLWGNNINNISNNVIIYLLENGLPLYREDIESFILQNNYDIVKRIPIKILEELYSGYVSKKPDKNSFYLTALLKRPIGYFLTNTLAQFLNKTALKNLADYFYIIQLAEILDDIDVDWTVILLKIVEFDNEDSTVTSMITDTINALIARGADPSYHDSVMLLSPNTKANNLKALGTPKALSKLSPQNLKEYIENIRKNSEKTSTT